MTDRRSKILEAATELIAEGGVAALTMRRLGERIGFTPPVIYEHFSGRDAVLEAVADRVLGAIASAIAALPVGIEATLPAMAAVALRHLTEDPANLAAINAAKAKAADGPGQRELKSQFEAVMHELNRRVDPETVELRAGVGWATFEGIAQQLERGNIDQAQAEAMVREAFTAFESAWTT